MSDVYENWITARDKLDAIYDAKESGEDYDEQDYGKAVEQVVITSRAKRKAEGRRSQ